MAPTPPTTAAITRHGRRAAWMARSALSPLMGLVLCYALPAAAATETITGNPTAQDGNPSLTALTYSPSISAGLNTNLTTYSSSFKWNYTLLTFTVDKTGSYTAASTTSTVVNTSYILTGTYTPTATFPPVTPISQFLASDFSGGMTSTIPITLTAGTTYSILIAYNQTSPVSPSLYTYTVVFSGVGCAAFTGYNVCSTNILPSGSYLASNLGGSVNPAFQGGTLKVDQSGNTYAQAITLGGSGSNTIDQAGGRAIFSGSFSNATSGSPGTLVITNSATGGAIVLTAVNTYTGRTSIGAGATLALSGGGSIAASAGVANSGMLDISAASAPVSIVTLSGNGGVTLGGQTLVLTGAADSFGGAATGTGGLTVSGGTETLTGSSTYTGQTTVASGAELDMFGAIASPVLVQDGGTLRSVGSIGGAVTVQPGGTLAVGATPGQLVVAAPVTLAAGSTLSFDIDGNTAGNGAGHYSQLVLTGAGSGFTAGGTLAPVIRGITGDASNNYVPALGDQLMIVTAQGGVGGSFSGLAQPAAMAAGTRFDTIYRANSVTLAVTPTAYGNLARNGLAETAGEAAVGRAIDGVRPAAGVRPGTALAGLLDPLYALPAAAIAPALGQLSPAIYGDGLMAERQASMAMTNAVADQLSARRDGIGQGRTAAGPGGSTVWLGGLGVFGAAGGASGVHTATGGVVAGLDAPVSGHGRAGIAVGGGNTHLGGDGGSVSSNGFQVAAYGTASLGRVFLDGQVHYDHADQDVRRNTSFWGTGAKGNAQLNGVGGGLTGGVHLTYGQVNIDPQAGLSLMGISGGSVAEDAGGGAAEQIGQRSITSLQSFVGARASTSVQVTPAVPVALHGVLGWNHEFRDTLGSATASLAAAPAAAFRVGGVPVARDTARVGGGLDAHVTQAVSVFAGYEAEVGRSTTAQTLQGGVRVVW